MDIKHPVLVSVFAADKEVAVRIYAEGGEKMSELFLLPGLKGTFTLEDEQQMRIGPVYRFEKGQKND